MTRFRGKLTRKQPGRMTRLEERFRDHLQTLLLAGEIEWFGFEAFTVRLAKRTRYTPDFAVFRPDGSMALYEVKGSWKAPNQDKSRTKLKIAAEMFPMFHWIAVTRERGQWRVEEIGA